MARKLGPGGTGLSGNANENKLLNEQPIHSAGIEVVEVDNLLPRGTVRYSATIDDRKLDQSLRRISESKHKAKSDIVREALTAYSSLYSDIPNPNAISSLIQNRSEIILFSRSIVIALQDVIDFDDVDRPNRLPPELWIDDRDYINIAKEIVSELKRLNSLLETRSGIGGLSEIVEAEKAATPLKGHLNTFLDNYISTIGKGAGVLTTAAMTALLLRLGVPGSFLSDVLKNLPH